MDPVEPRIRYSKAAEAKYRAGVPGTLLDVPGAADMVSDAYFQPDTGTLTLPMTPVPAQVSDEEAERVFAELAQPAVALPVALAVGEESAEIPPADIARTLTFEPKGTTMEATLDGEKLHKRITDELAGIEQPGRDATVRIKGGKPVVVPSRTGRSVDSEELGTAVFAVLPETTADARTAVVALSVSEPDLTTAEAKALNITEKLSSFRQAFPPAPYRYTNVGEAARRLNGTILEPGETFSMNDTVKERTRANGYTEGFIISGGRFREELGGGVSIITTATWTAGFYAGLERVEQHPHGLYISRYQAGLEATVAWGLLDLRMRNETGNGVLITAKRYNDGVLIEMWGTKKWDDVTATFTERRNYTDFQTIYDDGDEVRPLRRRPRILDRGDPAADRQRQVREHRDLAHDLQADTRTSSAAPSPERRLRPSARGHATGPIDRSTTRIGSVGDENGEAPMTYVIALPCVDLKDKACIEECPVDCIYEGERMLYIHPDECVDCGACEPVCPVEAIYYEDDVPAEWTDYTAANAEFFNELGSPGGAAKLGLIANDVPLVKALPPQEHDH